MNRSVISLLLVVLILLSLASCKGRNEDADTELLPPGVMLVPEDFDAEFDSGEDETAVATEETEAKNNTSSTEETKKDKENSATEETTKPTETKVPDDTQDATIESTEPTEIVTELTEYEWYNALSGEQQVEFMGTFASMADFFEWYNAAKEEYEKENPSIEIGDGNIDLGEIIAGNG